MMILSKLANARLGPSSVKQLTQLAIDVASWLVTICFSTTVAPSGAQEPSNRQNEIHSWTMTEFRQLKIPNE